MTTPRRRITFPPGLPKAEQIARAMSFVDEGWRDENRALASKAMDLAGEDFDPNIYDAVAAPRYAWQAQRRAEILAQLRELLGLT